MRKTNGDKSVIIVTGAAGFIGSAVVRELNDRGYDHLLLVDDIKSTSKWKNLVGKRFLDFISKYDLFSWLEDQGHLVKSIIHLGACSDTTIRDGDYLMKNNYQYSKNLAQFALDHDVRYIYASSAATYGDGKKGFSDDESRLEELEPLNLYGFSKHLFDLWAKHQGILDRMAGLKYFNVFGPNEHHKDHMASMIFKMFPKIKNEGVIHLFKSSEPDRFADGEQCRDFIYIKDAAKMTCDFLDNTYCGIFNIGRGKTATWKQMANALFQALDRSSNIQYIDMPQNLLGQYQNYTCADMAKYFQVHGYGDKHHPFSYSMEDAIHDYVHEHLLKDRQW